MKPYRVLALFIILILSASSVAALPSWMVKLFGVCDDSDGGPGDPDKPVPFIGIPGIAQNPSEKQTDFCVDEAGEKKGPSLFIKEFFCRDGKVESKAYKCPDYGYVACVETPRGAQCVKQPPAAKCGDNVVQPPEQCDPPGGACVNPAGKPGVCNVNCRCVPPPPKKCGDKIVQPPEQCDPPGGVCKNAAGMPGVCNAGCKCVVQPPPQKKCGDKIVQPPEQCDPPGKACKDAKGRIGVCSATCGCQVVEPPRCGDQNRDKNEECDPPGAKCVNAAGLDSKCSADCKCPVTRIPTWCSNNRVDAWEDCDPPGVKCVKGGKQGVCNRYCKCAGEDGLLLPGPAVSVGGQPPVQPPPAPQIPIEIVPLELVSQPQPAPVKSCPELCAERGMGTSPVDHSQYIMTFLQQYSCVSGASIKAKGTLTLTGSGIECKCYPKDAPEISVSTQPPVCQTPCGPVSCGQSAQCPCPDKPNCVLTASCSWGGWKWEQNRAVPIIGTQSSAR